jgi:predicted RNA-binding Zn ribbon-like protein
MSVAVSLSEMQDAGFPMGGEPLVALDLADTLMTAGGTPVDLLDGPGANASWWAFELPRLPESPLPDPVATRRLRAAVRDLFDAHLEGRTPRDVSVDDVNATAASVPTSRRLVLSGDSPRAETRRHTDYGGNPALAAIATEAIELMTSPERLQLLRRCANPSCSMLFLAENSRRKWCSNAVCGNRVRVARYYSRSRAAEWERRDA